MSFESFKPPQSTWRWTFMTLSRNESMQKWISRAHSLIRFLKLWLLHYKLEIHKENISQTTDLTTPFNFTNHFFHFLPHSLDRPEDLLHFTLMPICSCSTWLAPSCCFIQVKEDLSFHPLKLVEEWFLPLLPPPLPLLPVFCNQLIFFIPSILPPASLSPPPIAAGATLSGPVSLFSSPGGASVDEMKTVILLRFLLGPGLDEYESGTLAHLLFLGCQSVLALGPCSDPASETYCLSLSSALNSLGGIKCQSAFSIPKTPKR